MEERTNRIIREINKTALDYYCSLLRGSQGKEALNCIKELGFTEETIDSFRLGYAGCGKKSLVNHLNDLGYLDDQIIASDLAISDGDAGIEDIFQNRIIIPIIDDNNEIVGFSGKRVSKDDQPIYLTHRSPTADENRCLFGLDHACKSHAGYMIICEGPLDAISLHQIDFDMAVALMGIRFTIDVAELFKKHTQEIMVCCDRDAVGMKVTKRIISILGEVGIDSKQIDISPYRDPFEFITKEGRGAFEERIRRSREYA